MNINNLFPSKYVKAMDLGDKVVTVTIRELTVETLGHGNEKEQKPVLWFANASKGLILNRTNAMIIASLYTPETDNWKGKQINLYAARVKAFGAWHDAVRVKEQIPARNVGAAKMPDALVEAPPIDDEEDLLDADEGNDSGPDNGGPDDSPWEPDTGPERATQDRLDHLHKLGKARYGAEWDAKLPKLVEAITTGATTVAAQLRPSECERLIKGIESLQAAAVQSTNGAKKPAKVAA